MTVTAPALEGVEQPKEVADLVHQRVAPVVRPARGARGRHNQMVEEDTVARMGLGGLKGKVPAPPEYTSGEVRLRSQWCCWDTKKGASETELARGERGERCGRCAVHMDMGPLGMGPLGMGREDCPELALNVLRAQTIPVIPVEPMGGRNIVTSRGNGWIPHATKPMAMFGIAQL